MPYSAKTRACATFTQNEISPAAQSNEPEDADNHPTITRQVPGKLHTDNANVKQLVSTINGRQYLVPYIKQYRDVVLSSDQMDFYRRRLLEVISTSESARKEHLDNVYRNKERRDEAVANGRCPRCGGNLVLRNGKYGQFYGCSNYPKCSYTHPA